MSKESFVSSVMRVSMSSPDLSDLERQAVLSVLQTPRLSMGPKIDAFEAAIAGRVGARHAVAINSGTAGLHLCVRAVGLTDGDWALTTPFSFVSSSNVLLYERVLPVFVDVEAHTGNLDPALVEAAAGDLAQGGKAAERWLPRRGVPPDGRLRGLLAVDVFGQPADYDRLLTTARRNAVPLIEEFLRSAGCGLPGASSRDAGRDRGLCFLPQQADHQRRRGNDRHRSRRVGDDGPSAAQPGPRPR